MEDRDVDLLVEQQLQENISSRQLLAQAVAGQLLFNSETSKQLKTSRLPFVLHEDFDWLLSCFGKSADDRERLFWANLLRDVHDWKDPGQVSTLIGLYCEYPVLSEVFHNDYSPIELESSAAEESRKRYAMYREHAKRADKKASVENSPSSRERVLSILRPGLEGASDLWPSLTYYLCLNESGDYPGLIESSDITQGLGWRIVTEAERRAICDFALQYLVHAEPSSSTRFGSRSMNSADVASVQALFVLKCEDGSKYRSVSNEVWSRWCDEIVGFVAWASGETAGAACVIEDAYKNVPKQVIDSCCRYFERRSVEDGPSGLGRVLDSIWDDEIAELALSFLKKPQANRSITVELTELVLGKSDSSGVQCIVESALSSGGSVEEQVVRAIFAKEIYQVSAEQGWKIIAELFNRGDVEQGKRVIEEIASIHSAFSAPGAAGLDEISLRDQYILIEKYYPNSEDPQHKGGSYMVSTRDSIASWKSEILAELKKRGTPSAVSALEHLVAHVDTLNSAIWLLAEARKLERSDGHGTPPARKIYFRGFQMSTDALFRMLMI